MSSGFDLAALVLAAATEVTEGITAGLAQRGFLDVRPAHGFAFVRISGPKGATVAELSTHLGVTKQAASQLTAQLVERGYVLREPDPRDGRSQVLRLTERGRACTRAAEQAGAATIAAWERRIGPEHVAALAQALHALGLGGPLRPAW